MNTVRVKEVEIARRQIDAVLPNLVLGSKVMEGAIGDMGLDLFRPQTVVDNRLCAALAVEGVL